MLADMDEGTGSGKAPDEIERMSFEQALAALEQVVQQLEQGDVPLDESITLYERGEKLRAACQDRLDAAQARIEKIVTDASGQPTGTAPLDETR
jgi:exodeoxyribonuclease VII small subunit